MDSKKQTWERVYEKKLLPWTKNPVPTMILEDFTSRLQEGAAVLDYGGGDGLLAKLLGNKNLDVTLADISEKALLLARQQVPQAKTRVSENPHSIEGEFKGILVWGVMHHIPESEWREYLRSFTKLLKDGGVILIGGHSTNDKEFKGGYRISPTTNTRSAAIDGIGELAQQSGLRLLDEGYFPFKEAFTGSDRCFVYFLLEKEA